MNTIVPLLFQTLAAAASTVAFSVLFGAPVIYYPWCALIGGTGWFFYLILAPLSSPSIATFLSTVAVTLMSRWFAVRKRCPVTIFLISGIIPLVPGNGIYQATYFAVTDQLSTALDTGFQALKLAIAIVLGIVLVFELPQSLFRPRPFAKHQKTIYSKGGNNNNDYHSKRTGH